MKGKVFQAHFQKNSKISQIWMNRWDCWDPDGRSDTKIDQIDLSHISMSYASFVWIWYFMSYDTYDININMFYQ